jgi:hypothetical protein
MVVRSSLIRSFDIKEKSSKWLMGILIASLIGFYIWSIYSGNDMLEALKHSLVKTMGFYLSWCFARELDPDAKVEAFYGLFPLFIIFIFVDEVLILPGIFFLLLTRILTRSSGNMVTNFDLIFILFFSVYLYFFYSFIFPLSASIFIFADYRLKGGQKRNIPYASFMLIISLLSFLNLYTIEKTETSIIDILMVSAITPIFAFRLSTLKNILSTSDRDKYFLSPKRIKLAGILLLMSSTALAINYGYIFQMGFLWMAMLGISIPHIKNLKTLQKPLEG